MKEIDSKFRFLKTFYRQNDKSIWILDPLELESESLPMTTNFILY